MDFSQMSDEELLKPDAQASAPDFSQMSDEELLKPDRPNAARPSNLEQMSDEDLLKPDAPDFSKMSDEELLKPDAAQEPEKKDIGIGGWMKAELAAKQGREVSGWDVVKNKLSLGIDDANENRKAYVEQRLAMMEEDNPIEMIKLAQSIGLDQAKIDEIMERADSGQRSAFGLKLNPKIDVMKQGFSELAKPLMEARLKAREAAQQTMAEAKELGAVGKIVKGAADMGPTVAAYMNPVTAGIQTAGNIVNRLDNLQKDVYKLDENGNPVLVQAGDRSEAAAFKAVGGGYAEYLIWGVGVRKILGIGGDALKSIPGIGKYFAAAENAVKGTAGKAASPITEKAAAAWKATTQKLGESAGGRVLLKTGELLGKIDDNLKVGSLPHMVVKSRLTEFLDEVVGLNAREGERESLGEWLDKVTSVENNADMLLGMIAVHVGMAALSAHGRAKTQKEYNKALDKFKERVKAAYGEEKAKQFSDEDYRRIFKIVNSPNLTPESMTKLIDRITGEIDAQVADAKGRARGREEETEDTSAIKSGNAEAGNGNAGEAERSSTMKPKALDLLGKMDEGAVPVEDVAIGDVEGLEPSDTGKAIEEYDPAKAKPIVVWEDLEGNRHAVTGGKRLAMAGASGAETVKGVVVKEADGWTEAEARSLGTTENLREGSGTLKNVVEAVDSIGADGVAELAGWHQANGSREFASTIRKGLAVAQKGGAELKAALAEGRIGEDFAYNAAQVLSMERVGEGWETAQRELAGLIGKVGPEELEAVLWGLKRRLGTDGASGGPAPLPKDGSNYDWAAAIAEERAKYNAKKGGGEGKLDSDQVLIETADDELKTLGEIEAESGQAEHSSAIKSGETAAAVDNAAEAPELAAAEGAGANKAVELRPIQGRDGAFGTLSHPKARFRVDGEGKIVYVEGLTPEDFASGRAEATAALVARIEAFAVDNGLSIGIGDEATLEAWRATRERIRSEAERRIEGERLKGVTNAVVEQLKKSGLAGEVVGSIEEFNAKTGQRLTSADGDVYGIVDTATGNIYLNPEIFGTRKGLETPIHEFGHLGIEAAKKVNKPVYDRGMKLAGDFLANPETAGSGALRELVDFVNDNYKDYSAKGRADELLAQLIGKRGEAALRAETNATVANKIKAWLVEFWNTFGKALGLKDITPEEAAKMTVEQVADAIRAEMMSGQKYGEGLKGVEFTNGGARVVTKPVRIKRKLSGRRKAVNEFVRLMGGGDDPANPETDLLALWVDNGGRLFDRMPFDIETTYSKGASGVKKTRRAIADEFTESTAFYRDLDAAQRRVFFGSGKLETGPIGEILKQNLEAAGITRFTREDGTVDFEGLIDEFKRQWTNYENAGEVLKERNAAEEEYYRTAVEEMQRAEQAAYDEISAEEAAGRAEMEAAGEAQDAQIAADLAAGRFSRSGVRFSRGGIFTGTAADYANHSRQGGVDDGPSLKKIGTGEGSQVYGWGLYGSTVRGVAEGYAKDAREYNAEKNGKRIDLIFPKNMLEAETAKRLMENGGDVRKTIEKLKRKGIGSAIIKELEEHGAEYSVAKHEQLYEQTFFTNRAPGDESHLLKWYEPVSKETWDIIREAERANGTLYNDNGTMLGLNQGYVLERDGKPSYPKVTGQSLYETLAKELGSPQAASEFLARAGIDGVKYPVDSYGGKGVKGGDKVGWNYVSFRDDNIRVDHKWTDGKLRFSRAKAVGPSALGDGKQRYYEVPFDKAVDKIVKNKKPVSRDHVFVGETPKPFADIGFARLPVMMGQGHVISCYFGEGEGVEGKHLHKMKGNLKLLPKALEKPLMIIASESSPSDSVVAILKMKDNTGASVIVPVKMSGVGRAGAEKLDAHIALTMFGKKNAWKSLVANAIEKEANGEVGVFYIDGAESKTILERLGDKAKGLGVAGLQSPRETKAHRNPENGNSGLQSPSVSISQGTLHSIADEGSPVKGGIVSQTATRQFKNWFGGSKVVDANGEPLVVYRGSEYDPLAQEPGKGVIKPEAYFTANPEYAKRYTGNGGKVQAYYLNIRRPFDIRDPECLADLKKVYPDHEFQKGKSGALDWAEASTIDGEFLKENFGDKYDGIIYDEGGDPGESGVSYRGISYVPLDGGAQVKSATDNIGTFDPGNNDIRFSRSGKPPEAELVQTTRVADDAGVGEQTPGAIAASRELSRQGAVPIMTKGTRYVSLPLSEMRALNRYLTGHAMPDEMQSGRKIGAPGKASTKNRKLMIAADVLGTVDKSDMAAEKATLQQHGFFRNEDAQWAATHSKTEIRQERERSDAALSSRLEALSDRRVHGKEPGGQMAATRVYADQLAKIVMAMPHGQPGVLGAMQTVAGALEKRVRGNEAEAEAFLDWMSGQPQASGQAPRSAQERKAEMFAAFLMMPKEMESRAKGWYDGIRSTIAADKKLTAAFREMTVRMMSEQGYVHLQYEIERAMEAQTEAAIKKLNAEANEPIAAGGLRARATEAVVLSCDDRMGAAMVRVNAATRNYLAAQKLLMKQAKTPADRAAIKQQTDIFIGEIAQAKNQVELSRTAWERGHNNVDARYLWRVVDILNEATVRDGLKMSDISLYLDQQRVIETKGLSGSRGESARQAQIILDAMKKRLGGDYAKIEAFAQKFHAIHEQELLNDPALERVLGKGTVEYWKSQTHYVTTKRQHSPEELAEIEAARRLVGASGKAGGDTVIGQMYKYCTRPDATAKLKGSFADKQEVMSATLEKVAAIKKWVRRNDYVIELRDLLVKANVEGVHDFAAGKNEFPNNKRYGSISYMENGQKRTLVVPREIADGFKAQSMYDNAALKLCAGVNNIARQLWIDWNPVYWQRNIARNAGSIEMNMPGMREAKIKRAIRFAFPGLAPVTEIAMTHLVRHMPEKWSMPLRKVWGEHTALFYAPKAKRMAMWLTDHNEMQRRLWDAERRGDLGAIQEMEEDRRDMLAALRANMLVGISAGKASGTSGFLDDSVKTVGKTMQREIQDAAKKATWRKALDTVNIFSKNAKQQVFEDVMAKFTAYLHDRAQFGKGNNRTAEESGLMVKKNVSIGEGERKGGAAGTVQAVFQPFWNMVEKGVVRNVKAYGERTGETMEKAAWRLAPMILHGLIGSGAIAAWILKANDNDEEKVKSGKLGEVYRYLRETQRAYQNCSNYVRNNYHVMPLWTDGYTSVILGMPLTDEERLLKPIARFVTDAASVASGTKESMDVAGFMSDATGTIAPDFKIAGALPTLLDDTVHALMENPTDYYTGGQKYDKDLHALRNESWEMRGRFLAAMGKRLWNDFGGRNVLPVDRAGVDNGLGKAPGWVATMVNDIPIASPILRSFVKVQVGSPRRDATEISEAEARSRAIGRICAKDMFEKARRENRDLSLDPVRYGEMLDKWQQAYGLTPDDMAQIEARYLNAWRAYEGAQFKADGEREKFRSKAEKLGLDAAGIWLDWD